MLRRWLFLLFVIPFAARPQPSQRFSLTGQMIDGMTGNPLAGVPVTSCECSQSKLPRVVSGPDGRFAWHNLPEGVYGLQAVAFGETIRYGDFSDGGYIGIDLGPRRGDQAITFVVRPRPSISGTIRDEFGDPLEDVDVVAFRRGWMDDHVGFVRGGGGRTDDQGRYELKPYPGAYFLVAGVSGIRRFDRVAPQSAKGDFNARNDQRFYARSFYPADPPASFQMNWGEHRQADFTIQSAPAIRVHCRIANGPMQGGNVLLLPVETPVPGVGGITGKLAADGTSELYAYEPGRYRIDVSGNVTGPPGWYGAASQAVILDAQRDQEVEVVLQRMASIELSVHGDDGREFPSGSVGIELRPRGVGKTEIATSGYPIPAGEYWVAPRTEPGCIESAKVGNQDVSQGPISLAPGVATHLDVTVSQHCAEVAGRVIYRDKPAAYAIVAILVTGTAKSPGKVLTVFADDEGGFSVKELPAGRYLIWAWNTDDPLYPGPTTLAEVENRAKVIVVNKGEQSHAGDIHVLEEAESK